MQVNQELCTGCGVCVDVCSVGAIQLIDQRAVVDNAGCTQCKACIDACPNGAITAVSALARSAPIVVQPASKRSMIPAPTRTLLPETAVPARGLASLAAATLAFLGREVAPRLADVLVTTVERMLTKPKAAAITPITTSSRVVTTRSSVRRRQARYRGGQMGIRNLKGRR